MLTHHRSTPRDQDLRRVEASKIETTPARRNASTTGASRYGKAVSPSCEIKLILEKSSKVGNIWLVTVETTLRHTNSSRTLLPDRFAADGYTSLVSKVVELVTRYAQKIQSECG